jgi:hypothetical protein
MGDACIPQVSTPSQTNRRYSPRREQDRAVRAVASEETALTLGTCAVERDIGTDRSRLVKEPVSRSLDAPSVDTRDLEPGERVRLIDSLEALETLEIELHELAVLREDADLLAGDEVAALDTGGEDGHGRLEWLECFARG